MTNIEALLTAERKCINDFFKANNILAVVNPKTSYHSKLGVIHYGLKLSPNQTFAAIEKLQRELTNSLLGVRKKLGFSGEFQVLPTSNNGFGLLLPHPQPETLYLSNAHLANNEPHQMLLGMSVDASGRKIEDLDFNDSNECHILIAAITGAGKTNLLQTMMLSLCYATDPNELKLIVVDLKNEDLLPLASLPHCMTFANDRASAIRAIEWLVEEKDRRNETGDKPYRIVLVVDEMAQIADKQVVKMLGELITIGRSKQIHLVVATQHASKDGGLGSLMKANFGIRLVGKVAPQQSHIATGKPNVYAHLLPGKGSFLLCDGRTEKRFQSFFVSDVEQGIKVIQRRWGRQQVVIEHISTETLVNTVPIIVPNSSAYQARIPAHDMRQKRDEISEIADKIRPLWEQGTSKNKMAQHAFGKQYAGSYAGKIDKAIERLASTTEASTTASTALLTRVGETDTE